MNKKVLVIILLACVVVAVYIFSDRKEPGTVLENINNYQDSQVNENQSEQNIQDQIVLPSQSSVTSISTKEFTLEEISRNNTEQSCYSVINDNVYDLTSWIQKHPGGARNILRICGKDGTAEFGGQHGGEQRPESILDGFKIGVLKK